MVSYGMNDKQTWERLERTTLEKHFACAYIW